MNKLFLVIFISYFVIQCQKQEPQKTKIVVTESNKYIAPQPKIIKTEKKIVKADGTYKSLSGDVSHKRANEVVWQESQLTTHLFLKDWVRTSAESRCEINMNNKRIIKMSENSRLILLDKQDQDRVKRAVIGVSEGDIQGEVSGEDGVDSQIVFKLPNAWVRVKSSLKQGVKKIFRISLTSNKMKVHAEQGDIEILTKGKTLKLTQNKVYEKKSNTGFTEVDYITQLEVPKEIIEEKPIPKKVISKSKVRKFKILEPKNGFVTKNDSITVKGITPDKQEVVFRGKTLKVVNNKFKLNIKLIMGFNTLTFQVIDGQKVKYVTLELERR